ncbi:hypothetical protein ACYSUO_16365 [Streptomyces sp. UC4497]
MPAALARALSVRADVTHRSDDKYVPQQPSEDGGFLDFMTSIEVIAAVVVGLIALTLLIVQLVANHRGRREEARRQKTES